MKKILLSIVLIATVSGISRAQTAADFTLTDHDGVTHNLYSILNSGKAVYIDFFEPECGPCAIWHDYHTFEDFYQLHGPSGDNTAMCFLVNTWGETGWANITGDSSSMGYDFSYNVTYPIITLPNNMPSGTNAPVVSDYSAWGTPTVVKICPDKSMQQIMQLDGQGEGSVAGLEAWMTVDCGMTTTAINDNVNKLNVNTLNIYPNPAKNNITINTYDPINKLKIFNSVGQVVLLEDNILKNSRTVDLSFLNAGLYFVQIENKNGVTSKQVQVLE